MLVLVSEGLLGSGHPTPPTPSTPELTATFLREIGGKILDSAMAADQGHAQAAYARLQNIERELGAARGFLRRQIAQAKPKGARLVLLDGKTVRCL